MMVNDREPEVTTEKLRAGSSPGVVRYVLAASLILIVVLFAILLVAYK